MIDWLQHNVWLCSYLILGLAALTFLLNFVIRRNSNDNTNAREERTVGMKASHNKNSSINQSAGDMNINININQKDESGR